MMFWGEGVRAKQFTTISVKVKHKKDKKLFLYRLNLLFHQGNKMHIHGKHMSWQAHVMASTMHVMASTIVLKLQLIYNHLTNMCVLNSKCNSRCC